MTEAIEYAVALDLPTAIASDGHAIIERDLSAGTERHLDAFPTPPELWDRYARHHHLDVEGRAALSQPLSQTLTNADRSIRQLRYYQVVAVNRVLRAVLAGQTRVLLLIATGPGKTLTALQLCWLSARFGEGATRIQGHAVMGREFYFATYQSLKNSNDAESTFEGYPPDFFDVVIVDECHRGSVPGSSAPWPVTAIWWSSRARPVPARPPRCGRRKPGWHDRGIG